MDTRNNVAQCGHCHPHVVQAIQQQVAMLNTNTRYLHPNMTMLAERLLATLPPSLNKVFFVKSGNVLSIQGVKQMIWHYDWLVPTVEAVPIPLWLHEHIIYIGRLGNIAVHIIKRHQIFLPSTTPDTKIKQQRKQLSTTRSSYMASTGTGYLSRQLQRSTNSRSSIRQVCRGSL